MLVLLLQILFVFACFLLVLAVLLQQGKGGGISGAFGIGGASQTLFGASGAGNVLTKATWVLGGTFMLLSLVLSILSGTRTATRTRSVLEPTGAVTAPAVPPADGGTAPQGTVPGTTNPGPVTTPAAPSGTAPTGTAPAGPGTSGGTGN